jgi:pimeloyl-ACP methyl ester carboxylesterase
MRARAVLAGFAACAATAFGAVGAEPAQAAMSFEPCTPAGFECGSLAVPLVRGAAARGSLVLRATRRRVGAAPSASAVVPLAGGPGQAALPLAADFAEVLAPALAQRDLLVFDERGTGRSGRLSCRALDNGGTSIAAVNSCAAELGAVRAAYRTADTVADLEDLRREAGYERLVLVGVSYGTKVALDYAAAHPDRVEALVLDSVVPPEGCDPASSRCPGCCARCAPRPPAAGSRATPCVICGRSCDGSRAGLRAGRCSTRAGAGSASRSTRSGSSTCCWPGTRTRRSARTSRLPCAARCAATCVRSCVCACAPRA